MSRKAVLCAAGLLGVAAVAAVSSGSADSHRGRLDRSPDAKRVAAAGPGKSMSPREMARAFERGPAEAVRRGGVDARDVLPLLNGPRDRLPDWVGRLPHTRLQGGAAMRLRVARGVPKTWILTDRSGILVALAYEHSTAWFLGEDILSGHVLALYEDSAAVAVTGVLPDGTQAASISTDDGVRTLRVANGVYSERFAKTAGSLPRTLRFTDARGTHEVRMPLPRKLAR